MKPRQLAHVGLWLASIFLTSCNPVIYVPAFQNVPLFQKKGEVNGLLSGTNLQGAIAVGEHIALATNIQTIRASGKSSLLAPNQSKQFRIELAGGYFTHIKGLKGVLAEVYTGGGYGTIEYKQSRLSAPAFASRNWNVFVQPAIGFRRKNVSLALSARINFIRYIDAVTSIDSASVRLPVTADELELSRQRQLEFNKLSSLSDARCLFFEPAITATVGRKSVRLITQVFCPIVLINPSQYTVISPNLTLIRAGLQVRFN